MNRYLVALWLAIGVIPLWSRGQSEAPPLIQMAAQPRQYLAPANPEAKVRNLVLPFSTLTFTAKGEVIRSWTFTVFDSDGRLVSEDSRLETRDRGFFGELFNIGPRPEVEIPQELTWDGRYHRPGSGDGQFVPDGNYTYQIAILDSAGGRAQTPPFNATVKNAKIVVDYLKESAAVFAPLGQRRSVTIEQSGSREYHWEGEFRDASGHRVRSFVWDNPTDIQAADLSPPTFNWDGRDDKGQVVPDGDYTYRLEGFNRAGATLETTLASSIKVSERSGTVNLSSDILRFSPLAVGAPQVITFQTDLGTSDGLARWRLTVAPSVHPDQVSWFSEGNAPIPDSIPFRGLSTGGLALPEQRYQATLTVWYLNGNQVSSNPLPFDLVLTPPQAVLSASSVVFGGSGRPGITISLQGEPGLPWELDALDAEGRPLRHYELGDSGQSTFEFQGLDEQGRPVADGNITLKASTRNRAGIPGSSVLVVRKDSRPMPVSLDLSRTTVVTGRGSEGRVRITPVFTVVDAIESTELSIRAGTQVVAQRRVPSILTFWDWDGTAADGGALPDGEYQVTLSVDYANGTVSRASSPLAVNSHLLDKQSPQAELTLSSRVFSPENVDGPHNLQLTLSAHPGVSALTSWEVRVLDPQGRSFRAFDGNGPPPVQVLWDGRSDSGSLVESGEEYQILFTVTDSAGRMGKAQDQVTTDILVEKLADGRYKIVISSIQFSGYSSDLFRVPQPLLARNIFVLQRLAAVLNRLPGYRISLVGYAVAEFSSDPRLAIREQADQLIPLSLDRAEEVRNALVLLGVADSRFTVQGLGALEALVPNTDLENRWKNRRVEFYLKQNP